MSQKYLIFSWRLLKQYLGIFIKFQQASMSGMLTIILLTVLNLVSFFYMYQTSVKMNWSKSEYSIIFEYQFAGSCNFLFQLLVVCLLLSKENNTIWSSASTPEWYNFFYTWYEFVSITPIHKFRYSIIQFKLELFYAFEKWAYHLCTIQVCWFLCEIEYHWWIELIWGPKIEPWGTPFFSTTHNGINITIQTLLIPDKNEKEKKSLYYWNSNK